jgi:energy-coupling factor transporter ATPase
MEEKRTSFIRIKHIYHSYEPLGTNAQSETSYSLQDVSLDIDRGEYVAIIGANGSGKSTLLRHLNALLIPVSGDVWINGWNTRDELNIRDIRSTVSMVFQSPETQIVATVVEEDVAFGPENLGIPRAELRERVDWALRMVGLSELRERPAKALSVGQKQLLAIASALAMYPDCLVLDEATSSLDPLSRVRFLEVVDTLHRRGITIVATTHHMEEAARAERVVVLSEGSIRLDDEPQRVFSQFDAMLELKLDIPVPMYIARGIAARFGTFPVEALTVAELADQLVRYARERGVLNG